MRLKLSELWHNKDYIPHICIDCGKESPCIFMIKNSIWKSVASPDEILCFKCTEKRLGRNITWEDFIPCGASNSMILGALLMKRDPLDVDETILDKI